VLDMVVVEVWEVSTMVMYILDIYPTISKAGKMRENSSRMSQFTPAQGRTGTVVGVVKIR
jgi:hypothetical protein